MQKSEFDVIKTSDLSTGSIQLSDYVSYILHSPVGSTQICSLLKASKSILHSPENKQRDVISYKRLQEETTWQEKNK